MPRQELNINRIGQSTAVSLLLFAIFFTSNTVDAGEKLPVATQAGLGEGPKSVESGPLLLKDQETLELRNFVDKSVIEVFTNKRQAVMRRIYPTQKDSWQVALFFQGGSNSTPSQPQSRGLEQPSPRRWGYPGTRQRKTF
jgi:hypothetical protein